MCSCVGSKVCATSISLMGSVMDVFPLPNGVFIINSEPHWPMALWGLHVPSGLDSTIHSLLKLLNYAPG